MLRTTGRRSGATRTNALVYARDGDAYLIVASNGGADRRPAWLHNLKASPGVEVQDNHDRYTAYQQKTNRPIPVIAISPS